jgi:6-phosphogluconolactonase
VPRRILVCQSREDLFEAAAQFVVQSLPFQPDSGKTYSVALSGGSTPQRLFARLSADPYRSQIDWSSVRIFWGDEREVPPDHSESNFRMAKENLLDHVPIPPDQVFRMEGERPAQEAAVRYEEVLHRAFSHKNKEGVPRFDLILLGMGADGHTASLFPETSVLKEREQWVAAPWVEKFQTHRITLTPPVFNAAKRVLFVVGGSDKDKAAEAVLEGPFQPNRYPAQIVNPGRGDVVWLLDREAASRLKETSFTEWTRDSGKVM